MRGDVTIITDDCHRRHFRYALYRNIVNGYRR